MKAPTWNQNVLLLSDDPEIINRVMGAFGSETNLTILKDINAATQFIEKNQIQVLILDFGAAGPAMSYIDEKTGSAMEILQYTNQLYYGVTTVLLVNKLLLKDSTFARKCGATLVMDRIALSIPRLVFVIRILRKRTFRTFLTSDIPLNFKLPVDLFHYLPSSNRYAIFLRSGDLFDLVHQSKLMKRHQRHLYVRESELDTLTSSLSKMKQHAQLSCSEELANIRRRYAQLLSRLLDSSTEGMIHVGQELSEELKQIVVMLDQLVTRFEDSGKCIAELPYPRASALAHGINCAIYSLLFSSVCDAGPSDEIAAAALLHNLGQCDIDQSVLMKSEWELDIHEHKLYKQHPELALNILKKKHFPLSNLMQNAILFHHENFDGSGFPEGLLGDMIPKEAAFLSLVSSFDHFNTIRPGQSALSAAEAWNRLTQFHLNQTQLHKKFHPRMLKILSQIFESRLKVA